MASLYAWLKFIHILSIGTFLFVHGIAGGVGFVLRSPVSSATRSLLRTSQITGQASYPLLLVVIITGIWMTFLGHWSGAWPWVGLVVLVLAIGFMGYVARPYYMAREATKAGDEAIAGPLAKAKPALAAAVGGVALLVLFVLMVFKPF